MRKYIVITGGVLSGLGKGIAVASIGSLLAQNYKVIPIKMDGYLNTDPGTMNPTEHGEVFVLDDGGEVDMDFGHYERFLNITCKFEWNLTMGKIFQEIRRKERNGDYLGQTVQNIPHVTDLIKQKIFEVADKENADFVLLEVGGTVGDMENQLYLEAMRQLKRDVGHENIVYVHLTYVPIPAGVNEQKSKPTQQSVNLLRQIGIQPDIIIGRCSEMLDEKIKKKISIFCDVEKDAVISGVDVNNVYEIPLVFEKEGLANILYRKLGVNCVSNNLLWKQLVSNLKEPQRAINVAICGKYTKLEDSYASIIEALKHCEANLKCKINLKWLESSDLENGQVDMNDFMSDVNALIVPGGFGKRGTEGKIKVIRYCREKNIPFLGICLGLQLAVVEFARNVCGLENANSTEFDETTKHPIIDILQEQINVTQKGASMRLGSCTANILENSLIYNLYNSKKVSERHRHRYEVNPNYHQTLQQNGLLLSGMSENGRLVEFIELPNHKYFVATQSHPELKSSLLKPAPLFYGLVKAGLN